MATVREPRIRSFALWFGFLGAAAAWSMQEISTLALTSHFCFYLGRPLPRPHFDELWWTEVGVVSAAALVALSSLLTAFRVWSHLRAAGKGGWRAEELEATGGRAPRYLAFSGMFLGVVFLGLIILNGVALFVVPLCGYAPE